MYTWCIRAKPCQSSHGSVDECWPLYQPTSLAASPPKYTTLRVYTLHHHLLLLSPNTNIHFTIPWRLEG